MKSFKKESLFRVKKYKKNLDLLKSSKQFMANSLREKYSYNFFSLGRPIIQYPQDIIATQEIIWETKPDLIIETGIAHGGSLISNAAMLAILDICDALKKKKTFNPKKTSRLVLGIDINIRPHNKKEILKHPMKSRIQMIEGSSIDNKIVNKVYKIAKNFKKIMICLDSNHTHEHVLSELELYTPLVSKGNYCIVSDTYIENYPKKYFTDRPWKSGNSPGSAVKEFLKKSSRLKIDKEICDKLLISGSPDGFLKKLY
jgi:cephalosporin hydroxylase